MKNIPWIAAFLSLFISATASAATDYICLKACLNSSANRRLCLPKCSYDEGSATSTTRGHVAYRCLKDCVDKAGEPAVCVPNCTELLPVKMLPPKALPQDPANSADPLKPLETDRGQLLVVKQKPAKVADVDMKCVQLCQKGHLEYPLCSQLCTKN